MKRLLFIVLVCVWVTSPVLAQEITVPLVAVFNGQIYHMENDALVPYEACMPDEQLTPQFFAAPDGSQFLVGTMPRMISEAIVELGSMGDAPVSFNFWVCDTATNTLNRIHALPGGDEPYTGEYPSITSMQSRPAWSPDGSQIAWSTVTVAGDSYGLTIYDLATGTSTEAPLDLPPPFMFPTPPELFWGDSGLYMTLFSFNEDAFVGEDTLYTFDRTSATFSSSVILLTEGESSDFITDRLLVTVDGVEQFAVHFSEGGWMLVNPATGVQTPLDGVPMAYTDGAPDGIHLLMDVDENFMYSWQLAGNSDMVLDGYPRERITIAPDGSAFAYADSTLHVWRDGAVVDVANSDGFADDVGAALLWSQMQWTVAQGETVAEAPMLTCEGTQQSRLRVGDKARVVSVSVPNRLRDNPSIAAPQIGQIAPRGEFTVLDGPVCADGYAWYQVQFADFQGWTAEGSAAEYFIEPAGE